MLIHCALVLA